MTDTTITSANCVFTIVVPSLFPAPVNVQGFSSDKMFAFDSQDIAEIQAGVDGRMTAGYIYTPPKQTISLQADSPSRFIFTTLAQSMKTLRDVFYIAGSLSIPSTGELFTLNRGVLTNFKPVPDANKVLAPMDFTITWESVNFSLL